jgi:hypothetical protein
MQVEDLHNYGQDIFSMRANAQVPPLEKLRLLPAFLVYYAALLQHLGMGGLWRLGLVARTEFEYWRFQDWSALHQKGLSLLNLERILKEIVMAKAMADLLGIKKAAHLRRHLSDRVSHAILQAVFAPPQVFITCGGGDFLPAFRNYYLAYLAAMARSGLQAGLVVEDTPDCLQININYCAWAEISRLVGNPLYCYYSTCYADEVFFPRLAGSAGFKFQRRGTIVEGGSSCDHRFVRLKHPARSPV